MPLLDSRSFSRNHPQLTLNHGFQIIDPGTFNFYMIDVIFYSTSVEAVHIFNFPILPQAHAVSEPLPTCVNHAGKRGRRKSAGKGCTELVPTLWSPVTSCNGEKILDHDDLSSETIER